MSGEADIGEERIPAEDMLSVPTDCKSGTYKEKRSVDSGGTVLCWVMKRAQEKYNRLGFILDFKVRQNQNFLSNLLERQKRKRNKLNRQYFISVITEMMKSI